MILLEPGNRILAETVSAQIKPIEIVQSDEGGSSDSKTPQREPIDVRLCDFDDVSYRVVIDAKDRSIMKVSIGLPCYSSISSYDGDKILDKYYKGLVANKPENGYDVTLNINLDNKPLKDEELISKIQMLKPNLVGGIFDYYFDALLTGKIDRLIIYI